MFRVMTFGRARLSFLLAVILVFATLVIPATGVMADTKVTVHGTVRDNLANPFPNAEVQVIDPATGNTLVTTITDTVGYLYSFRCYRHLYHTGDTTSGQRLWHCYLS